MRTITPSFPGSWFRRCFLPLACGLAVGLPGHGLPGQTPTGPSRARAEYLEALILAEEGSRPEALGLLAESLRLQPENNPAAPLTFELLAELRTNSRFVLRGHRGTVLYAAYSPDGSRIVTASADHTARLWDARTGQQIDPALEHHGDVRMAEFNLDGTRVVTASDDQTARVWDAATGQGVGKPMQGSEHEVRFARFSPDGRFIATGAEEGTARVWDAATGEPVSPPVVSRGDVFAVNFSPDSRKIVIANASGRVGVLDAVTARPAGAAVQHASNVFVAGFSPDGQRLLTASADGTARLWDAVGGQAIGAAMRHGYWVESAAFNREATRVVTASADHTARVWDAANGRAVTAPLRHADAVYQAVFSPDSARVATASRDGSARVWDAVTGNPLTLPLKPGGEVGQCVFNPAGDALLIVSQSPTVQVRDLAPQSVPPAWLAELAGFASTQVRYDALREPPYDKIRPLREQLLAAHPGAGASWERFGRWYFLESADRPITPWSTVSLRQYVEGLIASGDRDSLEYALTFTHDMPELSLRITELLGKQPAAPVASPAPVKEDD